MCCCCMQSDTRVELDVAKYAFRTEVDRRGSKHLVFCWFANRTELMNLLNSFDIMSTTWCWIGFIYSQIQLHTLSDNGTCGNVTLENRGSLNKVKCLAQIESIPLICTEQSHSDSESFKRIRSFSGTRDWNVAETSQNQLVHHLRNRSSDNGWTPNFGEEALAVS